MASQLLSVIICHTTFNSGCRRVKKRQGDQMLIRGDFFGLICPAWTLSGKTSFVWIAFQASQRAPAPARVHHSRPRRLSTRPPGAVRFSRCRFRRARTRPCSGIASRRSPRASRSWKPKPRRIARCTCESGWGTPIPSSRPSPRARCSVRWSSRTGTRCTSSRRPSRRSTSSSRGWMSWRRRSRARRRPSP